MICNIENKFEPDFFKNHSVAQRKRSKAKFEKIDLSKTQSRETFHNNQSDDSYKFKNIFSKMVQSDETEVISVLKTIRENINLEEDKIDEPIIKDNKGMLKIL